MKQADYRSPEFYDIIATINSALTANNLSTISVEDGSIKKSQYNTGKYGNVYMWRVTSYKCPQLLAEGFMNKLIGFLSSVYPKYVADKIITCANPQYSKSKYTEEPLASIVIMLTELPDNIITRQDLAYFMSGDQEVIQKCLEIESRMFRKTEDLRDQITRIEDFAFSLIYEPKLEKANLKRISNLKLNHQTEVVTLETDDDTDFIGEVDGNVYKIEGKSTRADINYLDTRGGHLSFANYFKKRLDSGSLGSIHNADYVLFVLKKSGKVICINIHNLEDNWLAGKIDL